LHHRSETRFEDESKVLPRELIGDQTPRKHLFALGLVAALVSVLLGHFQKAGSPPPGF